MKPCVPSLLALLLACFSVQMVFATEPTTPAPASIPINQLGAEAQSRYSGDGISIIPNKDGARLRAITQRLEGDATPEGLWLTSIADEDAGKPNRFRVIARALRREGSAPSELDLPSSGSVRVTQDLAAWVRPGLVEEYTVSTDGVRQDFVIPERLPGNGDHLLVDFALIGAKAETAGYGVKLTVSASGRELAYSRLKVTDATGKVLAAEIQVLDPDRLRVMVQDAAAAYPVRVDPTFGDADWFAMPVIGGGVSAIVVDSGGNLYVGGSFTSIGTVAAHRIARWNGSEWSALGSGTNGGVRALAMIGTNLYAGGDFSSAGGISVKGIATWNGSLLKSLL